MTTLIAVYSSDGCEGRCDAKCYGAITPECKCICGGKNHGVGLNQAIENTRQLAEHWIEEYSRENNLDPQKSHWEVPAKTPQQLLLF